MNWWYNLYQYHNIIIIMLTISILILLYYITFYKKLLKRTNEYLYILLINEHKSIYYNNINTCLNNSLDEVINNSTLDTQLIQILRDVYKCINNNLEQYRNNYGEYYIKIIKNHQKYTLLIFKNNYYDYISHNISSILTNIDDLLYIKHDNKIIYSNKNIEIMEDIIYDLDKKHIYTNNNQILYKNAYNCIYSDKYEYHILQLSKINIPIYLQNIKCGVVIFNQQLQIIQINDILQKYNSNINIITDIFHATEYIKFITYLQKLNELDHILLLLNNGTTMCMLQITRYENIYVGIIYFDDQYNYGKTEFIYQQRLYLLHDNMSGILHDINNIITAISSYIDLLLSPAHTMSDMGIIVGHMQNLILKVIHILLKLLNIYKHRLSPDKILKLDIKISDFLNTIGRSLVLKHNIQLIYKNLADNMLIIKMDDILLEQIWINLVCNAVDAILERKTITQDGQIIFSTNYYYTNESFWTDDNIFFVHAGKYIEIAISDNGVGIDKLNQSLIFQKHFTTKANHTGFGLHTIYNIIKEHNGFINLKSVPGNTTFFIYLPQYLSNTLINQDELEGGISKYNISNTIKTILLIDDNVNITHAYSKILVNYGYNIFTLNTGINIMQHLTDNIVDLIIIDFNLPCKNGVDVIQDVRTIYPNMLVIYTSGLDIDELNISLKKYEYFLQKPFTTTDVINIINSIIY